ncbi:hypothetical protein [Nonomuraea sp. NPDC001699]
MFEAFDAAQRLPLHARAIIGVIVEVLRRAGEGDATGVSREFRVLTGQDFARWMRRPP